MIAEPAPVQEPVCGCYTIHLNVRDGRKPVLTYDEATAMHLVGIRFSIFDAVNGEFNVSLPYTTYENIDRGTLTFVQDPSPLSDDHMPRPGVAECIFRLMNILCGAFRAWR